MVWLLVLVAVLVPLLVHALALVDDQVIVQVFLLSESFTALTAGKASLAGVDLCVHREVAQLLEALPALLTAQGRAPGVAPGVQLQLAVSPKPAPTLVTSVRLLAFCLLSHIFFSESHSFSGCVSGVDTLVSAMQESVAP